MAKTPTAKILDAIHEVQVLQEVVAKHASLIQSLGIRLEAMEARLAALEPTAAKNPP